MAKSISIPGQGTVDFPDDMSDDEIGSIVKSQMMNEAKAPSAPKSSDNTATAFLSKALNAAGLGLPELLDKQLNPERAAVYEARDTEHPVASNMGELAGTAVPVIGTAGKMLSVVNKAARAAPGVAKTATLSAQGISDLLKLNAARTAAIGLGAQTGAGISGAGDVLKGDDNAMMSRAIAASKLTDPVLNNVPILGPIAKGINETLIPLYMTAPTELMKAIRDYSKIKWK